MKEYIVFLDRDGTLIAEEGLALIDAGIKIPDSGSALPEVSLSPEQMQRLVDLVGGQVLPLRGSPVDRERAHRRAAPAGRRGTA